MKRSFLIKPVHRAEYPKAVYGQGVYLYDDQGKQYLDGSSGAVTASIGHAVEEVVEAMYKQAQKVSFVYRSQMTSEPAEKLAEKLNELAFGNEENYSSFL